MAQLANKGYVYDRDKVPFPEQVRRCRAYSLIHVPRYLPRLREALNTAGLSMAGLVGAIGPNLTILDVGCGPGTCTLAALMDLNDAARGLGLTVRVRVRGRDRKPQLDTAGEIIHTATNEGLWDRLQIDWEPDEADMFDSVTDPADLVMFGHSICEQYKPRRQMSLSNLWEAIKQFLSTALKTRGVAVILEPIYYTERWIPIHLREALSKGDGPEILGPCPRQCSCPELLRERKRRRCGAVASSVGWELDDAGRSLRDVAVLAGKGILRSSFGEVCVFQGQKYFGLVVGRGARPIAPDGVGTVVARPGLKGFVFVCAGYGEGDIRLLEIPRAGVQPEDAQYETVIVIPASPGPKPSAPSTMPFKLSALYQDQDGWA
jgi:SAM-dependent methyltransferase